MTDIIIRPMCADDYRDLHAVWTNPQVLWQTMQIPSLSLDDARDRIANPPPGMHRFVAEVDGRVVGMLGLTVGTRRRSHGASLGMMVHPDCWGRGIGSRLMDAMIDLADNYLNLVRVELEVYPDNERAIGLYRKYGFEEEGRKRKYGFRGGEYVDTLVMARVK
ncbi:MAG: GNAT family N-acetyltransferase [Chloroflexi bacterium]|nr:GNAT family N-acetyltransferase [Chloroflexota bacterium]MBU1748566.1 GNAT family N-acetyltransferase [Chloroflexota bacterium]MBU1878433.1 GNAT family N-acetyltransferase [Chloroflexota bacterium]